VKKHARNLLKTAEDYREERRFHHLVSYDSISATDTGLGLAVFVNSMMVKFDIFLNLG